MIVFLSESMLINKWVSLFCVAIGLWMGGLANAAPLPFTVNYRVELDPQKDSARVTMTVNKGELLKHVNFDGQEAAITNVKANGILTVKEGRVYWELPSGPAEMSYFVKITHLRSPGKYDAMMTKDWALFRGDDVIPAMHIDTREVMGSYSNTTLEFVLPKKWNSIQTGWPKSKNKKHTFVIDNPDRRFDRPTGWMIAGKIGTRNVTVKGTAIAVSAPQGQSYQRMDALAFLKFTWPEVHQAFVKTPDRLLIVGADDPMWRGGLSAANSLFLHRDRPLVSENGTSPLLHELTHMVTRITGAETADANDDWIAEGLAEFYSFELLYRAHGISKARRTKIMNSLDKWGSEVKHLRKSKSTGPVTARAVILLNELDQEIQQRTKKKYTIVDVTQELMILRKVSLDDLRKITEKILGAKSKTLESPLLR
jgi:hypothetical protein